MHILTNKAKLQIPRKQVLPNADELPLQCAHCGSQVFRLHVKPVDKRGKLTESVCNSCLHVWKVDEHAFVEGDGKTEIKGINK